MKSIITIAILFGFILLIPIGVVQAYGLGYTDEVHNFSIDYPTEWGIENEFVSLDGIEFPVTFYDDMDGWNSMLEVRHYPDMSFIQVGTDQQWLNSMNMGLMQGCELLTFEEYGITCANHKLIDSRVVDIDGKKSYQLIYSWTEIWEDESQYENISIETTIPTGYDSWSIYSESTVDAYPEYEEQILSSINSFDILQSTNESSNTSESQRDNKIIFEEDVYSFLDFSQRPTSLVTPKEFTSEWYFNTENNFAIKFPNSWKDHWIINESFNDNKIAEFSSKNTDTKIVFSKEDGNLFQEFRGFDKNEAQQKVQDMFTESINRFPGIFHVDTLSVVKFSDGFVNAVSSFQIDEDGNINRYDVTYLIFESGQIVEVLYYGDNFSAISFNDYAIMFESGYVGDISKIPVVNESKSNSEIFVDSDLGFSFIPPKDWKELELNSELKVDGTPDTLKLITSFSAPSFQGMLGSDMFVMYMDSDKLIDFEKEDDEKIMKDMINGLKEGIKISENDEFEIIDSSLEHFKDSIKINIEGKIKADLDGIYIERQVQMIIWAFENGEIHTFMFAADLSDYDNYISEFRDSVDTVSFESKPEIQIKNAVDGGGCLIATATYGTELSPQVQFLREIRDNTVMDTASGVVFMTGFNTLYYSFSPTIADLERENPAFQELVRVFITPMISTLSLMTLTDGNSEIEVLGLGISIIALNLAMYIAAPALVGFKVHKHIKSIQ